MRVLRILSSDLAAFTDKPVPPMAKLNINAKKYRERMNSSR
jgi:hypothetical protein